MGRRYGTLVMGASYGSLLATKLALAGHDARLVCLPAEAERINREGARVRLPVKGREGLVEVDSRIPGVDAGALGHCYADAGVWRNFDPACMTLCSPDPQAFRPPEEPVNVLQVSLPTNFKAARFEAEAPTRMLREMQADIEAARFDAGGAKLELPVKLKVHDSVFVPLAKWSMLLTGNYRCVEDTTVRAIRDAVHADPAASKAMYDWVRALCLKLGAAADDLVPFEKYAAAAQGLAKPSSAARALAAGAQHIERVDRLVQGIAAQHGLRLDALDQIVARVDGWLARNRKGA